MKNWVILKSKGKYHQHYTVQCTKYIQYTIVCCSYNMSYNSFLHTMNTIVI